MSHSILKTVPVAGTIIALALAFTGCATTSAMPNAAPTTSVASVEPGNDSAVRDALPPAHTDYAGAQDVWTATVSVWPLPVPESHPFPETIPLYSLNEYDYYDPTLAAKYANFWWMCAASTAVVDARDAGDGEAEQYWLSALDWWGGSDTRSLTFADDGSSVSSRVATTATSTECTEQPGFDGAPIATP